MPKARITVLETTVFPEIVAAHAPQEMSSCHIFHEGQEFIVDRDTVAPEGFRT